MSQLGLAANRWKWLQARKLEHVQARHDWLVLFEFRLVKEDGASSFNKSKNSNSTETKANANFKFWYLNETHLNDAKN